MFMYGKYILQNIHEYSTEKETMQLLKQCRKSSQLDCWEALHIYTYHKQNILIDEQQITEHNDIFDLAVTHPPPQLISLPPDSGQATHTSVCNTKVRSIDIDLPYMNIKIARNILDTK